MMALEWIYEVSKPSSYGILLATSNGMTHPRARYHLDGKKKMALDDYAGALFIFLEGACQHGPHLLLSADMACCYYMLNDYQNYKKTLELLNADFQKYSSQISDQTYIGAGLALGLLLEESGDLTKALMIYQQTLERERFYPGKWRAQAAALRLMAFFDMHDSLRPLYQTCQHIPWNADAQVDVQHALMLADISLFNLTMAETRLINFLKLEKLKGSDKRLLLFDFYFESLKLKQDLHPDLKQIVSQMNYWDLDSYEKALYDISQVRDGLSPLSCVDHTRSESMSLMGSIRYLFLLLKLDIQPQQRELIRAKLLFLTSALDQETKNLIQTSWMCESSHQIKLSLDIPQAVLKSNYQSLSLQNHPSFISFLTLFKNEHPLRAEMVIQKIFQTEFDENSATRLRMLISRLNKKIEQHLGIRKAFQMSKLQVSLNPQIRWEIL